MPLLCAVLGLTIDREPTAIGWWNAVLVSAFLAVCSIAGAVARPLAWPLVFLPAIALAGSTIGLVAAIAAPLIALAALAIGAPRAAIGAVLGGTAGVLLLSLDRVDPIWIPTAAATVGFGLLFLSALYSTTERGWRVGAGFAGVVFFCALLFTGVAGIGAWGLLGQVDAGSIAAERGLAAARRGDQEVASAALIDADTALTEVQAGLDRWWMQPAKLVPIVSQHLTLAQDLIDSTADVVTAASAVSDSADFTTLRIDRGTVDLNALTAMADPLDSLEQSLSATLAELDTERSIWILSPLESELLTIQRDLEEALPATQQAALAARLAPPMLGGDGPRDYLVLFLNPATARHLGGEADAVATIRVDNGVTTLTSEPTPAPAGQPWTDALDPASALDQYQQATGESFDGVLVVDPAGLAALLRLAGPVNTTFTGNRTFTADDIEPFLLIEQFQAFDDETMRRQLLGEIAGRALLNVIASDIGTQSALVDVLGPAGRQGHLRFATADPEEQAFIDSTFLSGSFPSLEEHTDVLAVLQEQTETERLDPFVQRSIRYDVIVDPDTGIVSASLAISVTNRGPSPVEPRITVHTPWTIEGEASGPAQVRTDDRDATGLFTHSFSVAVNPGATATVTLPLAGTVTGPVDAYALAIHRQVLARPDQMSVTVQRLDSEPLPSTGEAVVEQVFDLTERFEFTVPLR